MAMTSRREYDYVDQRWLRSNGEWFCRRQDRETGIIHHITYKQYIAAPQAYIDAPQPPFADEDPLEPPSTEREIYADDSDEAEERLDDASSGSEDSHIADNGNLIRDAPSVAAASEQTEVLTTQDSGYASGQVSVKPSSASMLSQSTGIRAQVRLEKKSPHLASPMLAVRRVLENSLHENVEHQVEFRLLWNLDEYYRQTAEGILNLSNIFTMTGTPGTAIRTTCGDYLERTWPGRIQFDLLRLIEEGIRNGKASHINADFTIAFDVKRSETRVFANGSRKSLVSIAQQLAWLSASLRTSNLIGLAFSTIEIVQSRSKKEFVIQQLQLRHPSSSEVFNWHSNFPTGVVADNFDIPSLDRLGEPGVLLPCRERLLNMDDGMQMNNLELISDQVKLTHEDTHAGKQLLLTLPWKLPNYCQNELEECCDLGDVLVVTGSPSNAYAAGCRESLKIWWPNCRFDILDLVKQMMAVKTDEGAEGLRTDDDLSLSFKPTRDGEELYVTARSAKSSLDTLVAFVQQFAWLSASLRSGNPERVVSSEIHTLASINMVTVKLAPVKELPQFESSCWHPMFSHYVVAEGFPVPKRNEERGIELPYHLMTTFGRIRYPQPYLDGMVLMGISTCLVPVSKTKDCVQWHFICRSDTREQIPLSAIENEAGIVAEHLLKGGGDQMLNDFEDKNVRHFVGFSENVHIHLGTQGSSYNRVLAPPSNIAEDAGTEILHTRSITPNLVAPGPGMSSGGLTTSFVFPKSKTQELFRDDERLTELVEGSKDNVSILYDPQEKVGWLVSELSVILHLIHSWAAQTMIENHTGQYPYAEVSGNGGQAALQVIMEHRNATLTDLSNENLKLEQRVRSTWIGFTSLKQTLVNKYGQTARGPRLGWLKKSLYGYNFTHLAELRKNVGRIKVPIDSELSGGWESIPLNEPEILVIMCHDIGDVILPADATSLCSAWQSVPKGMHLLVASAPCIARWSRHLRPPKDTSMLSQKHYCHRRGLVFEPCQGLARRACQRIQKLASNAPRNKQESLSFEENCKDGAVIFGGEAAFKRTRHGCTSAPIGLAGSSMTTSRPSNSALTGNNRPSLPVRTVTPQPAA
ncbi:hypothetical protein Vi05172_g13596 [Venturia inaequalis]|nr:hypothetical protein Vi05172_g13596 [Venturia inaequalis]